MEASLAKAFENIDINDVPEIAEPADQTVTFKRKGTLNEVTLSKQKSESFK